MADPDFAAAREAMVDTQLRARGITDERILEAFRTVPREHFVDARFAAEAHGDHPLPIDCGQTISQPYIVALMTAAAAIGPTDRVLEVGAGSGYAAAILGQLAGDVIAVERHGTLAQQARERIAALGLANVALVHGDGLTVAAKMGPFDAILVPASAASVPTSLVEQLAPGGRLVVPVGADGAVQHLIRIRLSPDGEPVSENLGAVRFVPLVAGPDG